jgi:hypothetical protein
MCVYCKVLMPFTRVALASIWLITLGLFAMSGSGMMAGVRLLPLIIVALAAPAIVLTVVPKLWPAVAAPAAVAAQTAADADDLARMDSDKG